MDYFVTYNHSGVQFNLAHHRKNKHCAVKRRLRHSSRLLPWQTVIKSILLNQRAPAQISLLFGAQGRNRGGYAAHAAESLNVLTLILNSLNGCWDDQPVPNRLSSCLPFTV